MQTHTHLTLDEDDDEGERPGPVEVTSRDCAIEESGSQHVAISRAMMEQLVHWYSENVEPSSSETSETKKSVKLRFFVTRRTAPKLLTLHCTETDELADVITKVMFDMSLYQTKTYLFDPVEHRSFTYHDHGTLAENGISDGTVFCLLPIVQFGRKSGRVGLTNIGNTCYMNSSLQCLLHIPELIQYFLSGAYREDVNKDNPDACGGQFADAFYRLLKKIWDGDNEHINPSQFWDVLSKYYALFAEKDQHDTAELAETVLDGLMEDCNLAEIPKPYIPEMEEDVNISDEEMAEKCWTYHKYRSKSFITDKFHGQYRILTKCPECGFESRKFDSFTVLHLGLPPPKMRTIVFTLVEVCGKDLPRRYAIELSSKLLVKDLYKKVSKLLTQDKEDDDEQPWSHLCFILKRPKLIFLQLQDPIARISDYDEVLLYSYRGSEYGPSSGGRKTCFVHQKLVPITHYPSYYSAYSSQREEKQEFGYPLVLWLPDDDELTIFSKKRALFQDILEHSLRPFKRQHIVGIQEDEEIEKIIEEESKLTLFHEKPTIEGEEFERSEAGSMSAEVSSTHSMRSSAHSSQDDPLISSRDEMIVDDADADPNPLVICGPAHCSDETQITTTTTTTTFEPSTSTAIVISSPRKKSMDDEEDTQQKYLLSTAEESTHQDTTTRLHDDECSTTVATVQAEEDGEPDFTIGNLFEEEGDNKNVYHTTTSNHLGTNYTSSATLIGPICASSSDLMNTVSYGSGPSDAYTLTEVRSSPKDDETRMIVIDWDSNADQYYNLHNLEHPLVHPTAENAEDQRRKPAESVTIYDCLDHEFSPHPSALDGDNLWKCGSCGHMVNGVKSMRLWKTPDILLVGLKRFDYCEARDRLIKLTQMVDFPLEGLNLNDYYAPINSNDEESIYDLFGVCHHHGHGPKVGHYTSSVKSPDGKWYKFNDTWCIETDVRTVVNQDAYLLFYRKRGLSFPEEAQVLQDYIKSEREKNEEQAIQQYESEILDYLQGTSDDDITMNSYHQLKEHGCYTYIRRGDNGSSSSNEMNNENDTTMAMQGGASGTGAGSSSNNVCSTLASSSSTTATVRRGPRNPIGELLYDLEDDEPMNGPESHEITMTTTSPSTIHARHRKDDDFGDTTSEWPKANDPDAVAQWNSDQTTDKWNTNQMTSHYTNRTEGVGWDADSLIQQNWNQDGMYGPVEESNSYQAEDYSDLIIGPDKKP